MKLKKLHEEFIESSRRPMEFGRLPVKTKPADLPIIPMDRWRLEGDPKTLTKTYRFYELEDRNSMISALLEHEEQVRHNATMVINQDTLKISLLTKTIDQVTEIDKEYARFADQVFKDVMSNRGNTR